MAKVLLISPAWSQIFGSYRNVAREGVLYPPLGLCYLASSLRAKGHDVKVLDAEIGPLGLQDILAQAASFKPDAVGLTATSPVIAEAKKAASSLKEAFSVPVMLGGPHITIEKQKVLEDCLDFDVGIIGEGEEAVCEVTEALTKGKDLVRVQGIVFRRGGSVVMTQERKRQADLDLILPPERSVVPADKYLWSVPGKGIVPLATIMSSRGCPFKCIFCSQDSMYGNTVRFRSPEKVVEEIENIVSEYGIRHIIFCDDTLALKKEHIIGICDGIIAKGIGVTLEGWTRANSIDEEIIRKMKAAGFVRLSFGIETVNPQALEFINKGVTVEEIKNAYRLTKKYGIETRGSVIIGLPGDTKKGVNRTIKFLKNLKDLDHPYINIAMPYPGTKLRKMALEGAGGMRILTEDYSELRRYDNAVIEVNDLKRDDLIALQRKGLLSCYLTPRRLWHNLIRADMASASHNAFAFLVSFAKSFLKGFGRFKKNMPDDPRRQADKQNKTFSEGYLDADNYHGFIYGLIKPFMGSSVMEIGCGPGVFLKELAGASDSLVCMDNCLSSVNKLKASASEGFKNVEFLHDDIADFRSFELCLEKKIDTAVCINVLEHIQDDLAALINIKKILEPEKGRLILMVPALKGLYGRMDELAGHFRRYEKKELVSKIKEAGFETQEVFFINFSGILLWFLQNRFFRPRSIDCAHVNFFIRAYDKMLLPILMPIEKRLRPGAGLSLIAIAKSG